MRRLLVHTVKRAVAASAVPRADRAAMARAELEKAVAALQPAARCCAAPEGTVGDAASQGAPVDAAGADAREGIVPLSLEMDFAAAAGLDAAAVHAALSRKAASLLVVTAAGEAGEGVQRVHVKVFENAREKQQVWDMAHVGHVRCACAY